MAMARRACTIFSNDGKSWLHNLHSDENIYDKLQKDGVSVSETENAGKLIVIASLGIVDVLASFLPPSLLPSLFLSAFGRATELPNLAAPARAPALVEVGAKTSAPSASTCVRAQRLLRGDGRKQVAHRLPAELPLRAEALYATC